MFSYVFGDDDTTDTSDTDDDGSLTPDQETFVPLGQQLQQAEADVRSAFTNLVMLANNANDPNFETIPIDAINDYNDAQQSLVVTSQVYIDAQGEADRDDVYPKPSADDSTGRYLRDDEFGIR